MSALKVVRRKRFADGAALVKYCETHLNEELSIPCKKLDYLLWNYGISTRVIGYKSGKLEVLTYLERSFMAWAEEMRETPAVAIACLEASALTTLLVAEVNHTTKTHQEGVALRRDTVNAARERIFGTLLPAITINSLTSNELLLIGYFKQIDSVEQRKKLLEQARGLSLVPSELTQRAQRPNYLRLVKEV